ncbi:MAG: DUF664 domain-containing protein [Pyrinomonadaceae bacterium]|nr:DUF664 domain-containing protein [Pyrinomonadaceae bacterium]
MEESDRDARLNLHALRVLWEHHWWSFEEFLTAAFALSDEEFQRELGLSYGSVHGILAHIIGAEQVWLKRVVAGESVSIIPGTQEMRDKAAIKEAWEMTKVGWQRVLQEGRMERVIHYRNTKGQEFSDPLWRLMAHLVDHSATYRGILISALRILGRTPPASGVIMYTRAVSGKGQQ